MAMALAVQDEHADARRAGVRRDRLSPQVRNAIRRGISFKNRRATEARSPGHPFWSDAEKIPGNNGVQRDEPECCRAPSSHAARPSLQALRKAVAQPESKVMRKLHASEQLGEERMWLYYRRVGPLTDEGIPASNKACAFLLSARSKPSRHAAVWSPAS